MFSRLTAFTLREPTSWEMVQIHLIFNEVEQQNQRKNNLTLK